MKEPVISYPFGHMDVQSVGYAAAVNIEVKNQKTLVNVATMTGNLQLNASPAPDLAPGAELIVKTKSDATARAITLNTGFAGTTVAGTIEKTKVLYFVFDGTAFIHISTNQID